MALVTSFSLFSSNSFKIVLAARMATVEQSSGFSCLCFNFEGKSLALIIFRMNFQSCKISLINVGLTGTRRKKL